MIKLLHTADIHIGDKRYGRYDPERSVNTRLDDQKRCLSHLADIAIAECIDAAILAGDIYHGRSPSPAEEDVFAQFVARLTGEGIHVFALAGNHERPAIPGRASPLTHIATLGIERFHFLSEIGLTVVDIGAQKLAVMAIPWPQRRELYDAGIIKSGESPSAEAWDMYISDKVDNLIEQIPEDSTAILAAHLWTANVAGPSKRNIRGEPVCHAGTLAQKPFRYIALGHIHAHQQVWPDPPAVYSGSVDRTDFTEKNIPKGAVIAEIDEEKTSWRFVETPARKFVTIDIDLSGFSDPIEAIAKKAKACDIEGAVVRIDVTQKHGDPPIDGRRIRPKLPAPFFLRVVRKVITEDLEPIELKAYDPIGALGEYIDNREELKPDKEKLIALALKLKKDIIWK
ncbi:hypothetical protein DRQ36_10190 [bacterium]|nr:MAG: hypothetical protein DRQ36_10190 [bacterium]